MKGEIEDSATIVGIASDYAEEECVGQLGEVRAVSRAESAWIVEFRTHTLSTAYDHRVRISPVGNVFDHERETVEE